MINTPLNKILSVVTALTGFFFLAMGLRWLIQPASVTKELGMILQTGTGLSTQIGDLASFFLTVGLSILVALFSKRPSWYSAPILLLSLAAMSRLIAWAAHGASLEIQLIGFELLVSLLLVTSAQLLPERK